MSADTAFIICGALANEVLDIVRKREWDVDVLAVPALDHAYPERIAPDVEKRLLELREKYQRLVVVFGDCGSRGALDEVLAHHGIERIDGPHCYEMYGGGQFHELMEEELGSFFLTDFLTRSFHSIMMRSMGLDKYPELKDLYFQNYKRVVYLAQKPTPELLELAQEAADYLGLPLEVQETGYGELEARLVEKMNRPITEPYQRRAMAIAQDTPRPSLTGRRERKRRSRRSEKR
jgi:hypothetical protein